MIQILFGKRIIKEDCIDIMNKNIKSRNGFIHLYNPKKEGLGSYDVHYMNAYKKNKDLNIEQSKNVKERYAA